MSNVVIYLRKSCDRRVQHGHLWIFSNEIDTAKSPLKSFTPGQLVSIQSHDQRFLGVGYINPNCLLCVRILSATPCEINVDFFVKKIQSALQMRESIYGAPYYRLCFGESDGLPGLIVDRYDQTLIVQLNTAGMDQLQAPIIEALKVVLSPDRIVLRNDGGHRKTEGLELYQKTLFGDESAPLIVQENGATFLISLTEGQKTGWFYDHRDNRKHLLPLVKDKTVLDVFSYLGGWGIEAALAGADHVTCIDSSASAISAVQKNAELNGVNGKVDGITEDAFDALAQLIQQKKQFDIIIADPPAFIKSKKDKPAGMHAYMKLNRLAMQLLAPNGLLVSASCSMHLLRDDLLQTIQEAAHKSNSNMQILAQWHQGMDHPVHPMIPETHYLKAFLCRKA